MSDGSDSPVTRLLAAASQGDSAAKDRLWETIYTELRDMAHGQLRGERPGRDLQTTILVHEAYFRLVGTDDLEWASRRHFFAAAAQAMRRIRVDDARKRRGLKRGGGRPAEPLGEEPAAPDGDGAELLALNDALQKLEQEAPRQAEVVMLRYFAGLSIGETAEALGVSPRTVDVDWRLAKAWLHRALAP